jgi:hypothetical protein
MPPVWPLWKTSPPMGEVSIREDQAWMLQSRINPFPISGALALEDGRLSFTLGRLAAEASLGWLEDQLESRGLKERIESGEQIVAFDHALSDCKVSWPLTGGGATMVVEAPERKWVVSYDHPSAGQTLSVFSGRKKAKLWKKALAEAGG